MAIETRATKINISSEDGYVVLDVMIVDPGTREETKTGTLSCLTPDQARTLGNALRWAADQLASSSARKMQ